MEPFNRLPADSRNAQSAHYGNDSGDHLLIVADAVGTFMHKSMVLQIIGAQLQS